MFSLFTGKISGVFSLVYQGLSKALGFVVETVTNVVDILVDTVGKIASPITDKLTDLPLLGDTIESVLDLESNLLGNLSGGLHAVADDLSQGNLLGGVNTALSGVTTTLGQTIGDVVDVVQNVVGITTPVTDLVGSVPGLGGILNAAGETTSNLLGFVEETGNYVANIDPVDLVSGLITNPTGSIGGVIQDVSGSLDSLLNDLAPVTDLASELPVIGHISDAVGQISGVLNQGLYDVGFSISQIDLLNPLQSTSAYV